MRGYLSTEKKRKGWEGGHEGNWMQRPRGRESSRCWDGKCGSCGDWFVHTFYAKLRILCSLRKWKIIEGSKAGVKRLGSKR